VSVGCCFLGCGAVSVGRCFLAFTVTCCLLLQGLRRPGGIAHLYSKA
jgi:hypothetical protein